MSFQLFALCSIWLIASSFASTELLTENDCMLTEDCFKNYVNETEALQRWILSSKDSEQTFGTESHRIITALALSGYDVSKDENNSMAMKDFELKVALAFARTSKTYSKPPQTSLGQLALYIHGLLSVCKNPWDFHGLDLVSKLNDGENVISNYEFALRDLALCNAGVDVTRSDQSKLIEILRGSHLEEITDSRLMAVIALSCISERKKSSYFYLKFHIRKAAKLIKKQQKENGSFGNIYTSALAYQALIAAQTYGYGWNSTAAMDYILSFQKTDGSFPDIMMTYFVLPILKDKTMADIHLINCPNLNIFPTSVYTIEPEDITSKEEIKNVGVFVKVEDWAVQQKTVKTNLNATLYQILNDGFNCTWQMTSFGHVLMSVDEIVQIPSENKYWMFYRIERQEGGIIEQPLTAGADEFTPANADKIVVNLKTWSG